jgi:hypothetical protein
MHRPKLLALSLTTAVASTLALAPLALADTGRNPGCREDLTVRVGPLERRLSCRSDWAQPEVPAVSILGELHQPPPFARGDEFEAAEANDLPEFPRRLVIVTTMDLVTESTMLLNYINWRRASGWEVVLGTEFQWDVETDLDGDDRAARIRSWLQEIYAERGGGYLLLIGAPASPYDGVPMRRTQPLSAALSNYPPWLANEMSDVPTDQYYADLESDWDCDGDLLFGEHGDDIGDGCADWGPELITGRIPYYGNIEDLDLTLAATIDYERAEDKTYRDRALFAGAFGGFRGQPSASGDGSVYSHDDDLAGFLYRTADDMPGYLEVEPVRLFEDGGIVTSNLEHELGLTEPNLIAEWLGGASTVSWGGHGSPTTSHRQVWVGDANLNELAEGSEVSSPAFVTSASSAALEPAPLAVVHMMSCLNGHSETAGNLGSALLGRGAVATASASRVAVGAGGEEWEPMPELADATTHAYYFTRFVQAGYPVGDALAFTRWGLPGMSWEAYEDQDDAVQWAQGGYAWLTKLEYNLYGDPTVSLERCDTDSDCDDGLPCNGTERCSDGYCVHDDPVDCETEHPNPCVTRSCDNETGQCEVVPRVTGLPCDDGQWCTVDDYCHVGVCLAGADRECASFLHCNELTDTCEYSPVEEEAGPAEGGCQVAGAPGEAGGSTLVTLLLEAL